MSCELRHTRNPEIKLVMAYGEAIGEIARTRSGWLLHHYAVWSDLPPPIAAEAEAFAVEKCVVLNVTRRLTA